QAVAPRRPRPGRAEGSGVPARGAGGNIVRTVRISIIALAALVFSGTWPLPAPPANAGTAPQAATMAQAATPPQATPLPPSDQGESSAIHLFAGVEEAWAATDAERLAGLVDTTVVRIALKPGSTPTSAVTRTAAAFLFQDQLRLVSTRSFRIVRVDVMKKVKAHAEAEWLGDWGGRQGLREVKVVLAAEKSGNRWLLTEVRAND
ncbi:MAG TPA: hypothetical protein VIX13_06155, partial [Candidatus Eisenbacteria bacterium]